MTVATVEACGNSVCPDSPSPSGRQVASAAQQVDDRQDAGGVDQSDRGCPADLGAPHILFGALGEVDEGRDLEAGLEGNGNQDHLSNAGSSSSHRLLAMAPSCARPADAATAMGPEVG